MYKIGKKNGVSNWNKSRLEKLTKSRLRCRQQVSFRLFLVCEGPISVGFFQSFNQNDWSEWSFSKIISQKEFNQRLKEKRFCKRYYSIGWMKRV